MPELPEVETVVRGLRPSIEGRRIVRCTHASSEMAKCDQHRFEDRLAGQRFTRIERHGKWIFCRLEEGDTLAIHLGMTGRLGVEPMDGKIAPHTHLRLLLEGGDQELRFRDPRRFGEILLLSLASVEERFGRGRLGPDATKITARQLSNVFSRTSRVVKAVLLDQRALSGVGNIYADEVLFEAKLDPARKGMELSRDEIERLTKALRNVLRRAIRSGGSTIRDYVDAQGEPGSFQHQHCVYGRAGMPCKKCRTPIELDRTIMTGRATHWCRVCQSNSYQRVIGTRRMSRANHL